MSLQRQRMTNSNRKPTKQNRVRQPQTPCGLGRDKRTQSYSNLVNKTDKKRQHEESKYPMALPGAN